MNARHVASPFPTAWPVRLPASVLRVNKPAAAPRSDAAARVGATLRGLRLVGGVSGQVLAHRAGLSRSLLSRLERGLVSHSLDTLESVAAALGVPVARLLQVQAERGNFCHVPAGQGILVDQEVGQDCRCELLGHQLPGILAVEPCLVVQQPRVAREATSQSGLRFVYVRPGAVSAPMAAGRYR